MFYFSELINGLQVTSGKRGYTSHNSRVDSVGVGSQAASLNIRVECSVTSEKVVNLSTIPVEDDEGVVAQDKYKIGLCECLEAIL